MLDIFLELWLAALIVTVSIFLIAGILALFGKNQVTKAVPPEPVAAIESVKLDVDEVRAGGQGAEPGMTEKTTDPAGATPGGDKPKPTIEELRAEIKQTRADLGETVQALAAKADVKARAREQVEQARQRVLDAAGRAQERVRSNGIPIALVLAGVAAAVGAILIVRGRRR